MQRYNINNRLAYLSGGVQSAGGMWPSVAAGDWWDVAGETCVAAYQPKGAASLAASYVNLANPGTYDAAPGVAPTWASGTGWTFNGSTQYLDSGVPPTNDQLSTFIARYSGYGGALSSTILGSWTGSGDNRIRLMLSSSSVIRYDHAKNVNYTVGGGTPAAGVLAVAGSDGYLDGTDVTNIGGPWVGTSTRTIYLGAMNIGGTAGNFMNGNILAVAIYSTTLDATQISDLTTAMNAL